MKRPDRGRSLLDQFEEVPVTHRTNGRKPYPRVRKPKKTAFTPALWARWMLEKGLAKVPPDPVTLRLRAGIAEFRNRLRGVLNKEAQS